MNQKKTTLNSQLRELIDCCRSIDDLAEPEMAELAAAIDTDADVRALFDRSLRFDQEISTALDAGDVPAGLSDRLLEQLQSASAEPAANNHPVPAVEQAMSAEEPSDSDDDELAIPVQSEKRIDRRLAAWLTAGIVATVAGIGIVAFAFRGDPDLDRNQLAADCGDWIRALDVERWTAGTSSRAKYPIDSAVNPFHHQWQTTRLLGDSRAIVYAGMTSNQSPAYLFVIDSVRGSTFPNMPPLSPVQATGGYSVGVWKSKGRIYVLAVKGGPRTYRSVLKQTEFV